MSTQGDRRQTPPTEDQVFRGVLRALGVAAAVIALLVIVGAIVATGISNSNDVGNMDCTLNGENC